MNMKRSVEQVEYPSTVEYREDLAQVTELLTKRTSVRVQGASKKFLAK